MNRIKSLVAFVAITALALVTVAPPAQALDEIRETDNGIVIAGATTQKVGFHGTTPSTQRAGAAQAAVTATSTNGTAGAAADLTALKAESELIGDDVRAAIALVNELRAALVAKGLIKGAP